jgi:hypothetical protein
MHSAHLPGPLEEGLYGLWGETMYIRPKGGSPLHPGLIYKARSVSAKSLGHVCQAETGFPYPGLVHCMWLPCLIIEGEVAPQSANRGFCRGALAQGGLGDCPGE